MWLCLVMFAAVSATLVGEWLLREQHDTAPVIAAMLTLSYLADTARRMLL